MLLQTGTWNRIKDQFTPKEKELMNLVVTGETVCPRGIVLDEKALERSSPALLKKLREAMRPAATAAHA
jgi:hypothetical protein